MIHYEIKRGGSGNGISRWLQWRGCTQQVYFDELNLKEGRPTSLDLSASVRVGTLVHAYLELYVRHADLNPSVVIFNRDQRWPWGEPISAQDLAEARTIFGAYKILCGRDLFTDECRAEVGVSGRAASKAVGISSYTARFDLYAHLVSVRGVEDDGWYLIDHKVCSDWPGWRDHYLNSEQNVSYRLAAHAAGMHINGFIYNVILRRGKRVDVQRLVLPAMPSDREISRLHSQIKLARSRANEGPIPNTYHCRSCHYKDSCDVF